MRKIYLSLLLVSLFSGILVAWQLDANMAIATKNKQEPGLIDIIHELEKEDADLEKTIAELRQEIDKLQKQSAQGQGRLIQIRKQIESLQTYAGLTPVNGPGVSVFLDDNAAGAQAAKKNSPLTYKAENFIIHDKDVLYIINELRSAGAEAIAVNGLRIVTNSDIRCVGTVIMVNSTRVAPPYEIQAVGDPVVLEEAILNSIDYNSLKSQGFPVKVTKMQNLTLPAYAGSFPQKHTRILQPEGQS